MSNVKFGFGQLGKTTPEWAKNMFRVALYTAAAANFIVDTVTEIPPDVKVLVAKYSVYLVTAVHFFSKMWGIKISDIDGTNSLPDFQYTPPPPEKPKVDQQY